MINKHSQRGLWQVYTIWFIFPLKLLSFNSITVNKYNRFLVLILRYIVKEAAVKAVEGW